MRKSKLSVIICVTILLAIAVFTSGCNVKPEPNNALTSSQSYEQATEVGTGATTFTFTVTTPDNSTTAFTVKTDKATVGEALQELGLISGEEGAYGLYVKTVNGTTLDYDKDNMYWAFYINGEMAPTGVDMTQIKDGESYAFVAEK